ncbi:unnamed protein product [Closterium sp. Yama58-4]|nr:unnamed protein product [Closterium sp. Yama58-4]
MWLTLIQLTWIGLLTVQMQGTVSGLRRGVRRSGFRRFQRAAVVKATLTPPRLDHRRDAGWGDNEASSRTILKPLPENPPEETPDCPGKATLKKQIALLADSVAAPPGKAPGKAPVRQRRSASLAQHVTVTSKKPEVVCNGVHGVESGGGVCGLGGSRKGGTAVKGKEGEGEREDEGEEVTSADAYMLIYVREGFGEGEKGEGVGMSGFVSFDKAANAGEGECAILRRDGGGSGRGEALRGNGTTTNGANGAKTGDVKALQPTTTPGESPEPTAETADAAVKAPEAAAGAPDAAVKTPEATAKAPDAAAEAPAAPVKAPQASAEAANEEKMFLLGGDFVRLPQFLLDEVTQANAAFLQQCEEQRRWDEQTTKGIEERRSEVQNVLSLLPVGAGGEGTGGRRDEEKEEEEEEEEAEGEEFFWINTEWLKAWADNEDLP